MKKPTYYVINTEEKFKKFYNSFFQQKRFAFDTETTSLDVWKANILCFTFSWNWYIAFFIPIKVRTLFENTLINYWNNQKEIETRILSVLKDKNRDITAHNAKYDYKVVKSEYNIEVPIKADSAIYSKLLNELKPIRLSFRHKIFKDIKGYDEELNKLVKENNVKDYSKIPMDIIAKYAAFDALASYRLTVVYTEKLKQIQDYK